MAGRDGGAVRRLVVESMRRFGRIIIVLALVAAAGADVWPRLWAAPGEHKHYLHQAQAFLHGRLDIDEAFGDVATYQGKNYVVFPPFPALLITPLVAVFGDQTRTTVVGLVLTALNFFVLRGILQKLEIERTQAPQDAGVRLPVGRHATERWLLGAFFFGTAYTTSLFQAYESWHFAHIVAVTCLLLGVYEALGRGRSVLVGLACGLAFFSRQLCLYSAIFLAAALWYRWRGATRRAWLLSGVGFFAPIAVCVALYMWLNWQRFGDPFETGYAYLPLTGALRERVAKYGLFNVAYVPFNLVYLLLQGPHIDFARPALLSVERMDPWGTSLLFASPFVFLAPLARWSRALLWAAWIAIALPIVHSAFYYNNGFVQTNAQRFTLDFWPILIVLVALGTRRVKPHWWKAAIVYAIALNAVSLFVVAWLRRLTGSL
jgi:hypothetical protein